MNHTVTHYSFHTETFSMLLLCCVCLLVCYFIGEEVARMSDRCEEDEEVARMIDRYEGTQINGTGVHE